MEERPQRGLLLPCTVSVGYEDGEYSPSVFSYGEVRCILPCGKSSPYAQYSSANNFSSQAYEDAQKTLYALGEKEKDYVLFVRDLSSSRNPPMSSRKGTSGLLGARFADCYYSQKLKNEDLFTAMPIKVGKLVFSFGDIEPEMEKVLPVGSLPEKITNMIAELFYYEIPFTQVVFLVHPNQLLLAHCALKASYKLLGINKGMPRIRTIASTNEISTIIEMERENSEAPFLTLGTKKPPVGSYFDNDKNKQHEFWKLFFSYYYECLVCALKKQQKAEISEENKKRLKENNVYLKKAYEYLLNFFLHPMIHDKKCKEHKMIKASSSFAQTASCKECLQVNGLLSEKKETGFFSMFQLSLSCEQAFFEIWKETVIAFAKELAKEKAHGSFHSDAFLEIFFNVLFKNKQVPLKGSVELAVSILDAYGYFTSQADPGLPLSLLHKALLREYSLEGAIECLSLFKKCLSKETKSSSKLYAEIERFLESYIYTNGTLKGHNNEDFFKYLLSLPNNEIENISKKILHTSYFLLSSFIEFLKKITAQENTNPYGENKLASCIPYFPWQGMPSEFMNFYFMEDFIGNVACVYQGISDNDLSLKLRYCMIYVLLSRGVFSQDDKKKILLMIIPFLRQKNFTNKEFWKRLGERLIKERECFSLIEAIREDSDCKNNIVEIIALNWQCEKNFDVENSIRFGLFYLLDEKLFAFLKENPLSYLSVLSAIQESFFSEGVHLQEQQKIICDVYEGIKQGIRAICSDNKSEVKENGNIPFIERLLQPYCNKKSNKDLEDLLAIIGRNPWLFDVIERKYLKLGEEGFLKRRAGAESKLEDLFDTHKNDPGTSCFLKLTRRTSEKIIEKNTLDAI